MRPLSVTALILVFSCSQKLETPTPLITPSGDADTDADADSDADSDADADVDTGPQLDCTAPYDTPAPGTLGQFPTCVTDQVFCGQTVFGTTAGGSNVYDYDFWLDTQSLGALINKPEEVAGPERVYAIEAVFAGQVVTATIESCNPVWASWISMGDLTDYCDEYTQAPKQHFYEVQGRYLQEADIPNSSVGVYSVEIIVDSAINAPGNFLMTIECEEGN